MSVFVLDKRKQPLMPCSEKRARKLLASGRAVVVRVVPFVIRLKDRVSGDLQPLHFKLDPGSKTTGMALVRVQDEADGDSGEVRRTVHPLWYGHLQHRGLSIKLALHTRALLRRSRRSRNLRYRKPRFNNRTRPAGWLAPSLRHRLETTMTWVRRLCRWSPITGLAVEQVRFDMQALQNPEISGIEYQQGTLLGYSVREYLLEKFDRKCAYCGATDTPFQVEHVVPKALGGSNRVSNLALACGPCNQKKGSKTLEQFLARKPLLLDKLRKQLKTPLPDAAAVNATRKAIVECLQQTGLPVETSTGANTKFNRRNLALPKTHTLDAACVGWVDAIGYWQRPVLDIKAMGRGSYQRTSTDKYGFPRRYLTRQKCHYGFQTGDYVRAEVLKGKHKGVHVGRVTIRASGVFRVFCNGTTRDGIRYKCLSLLQLVDGYSYAFQSSTRS